MSTDASIVEEIHVIRQQIWDECGQDLRQMIEFYRNAQEKHRNRLVTPEQFREIVRKREAEGFPRLPKEPPYTDPVVDDVRRVRHELSDAASPTRRVESES